MFLQGEGVPVSIAQSESLGRGGGFEQVGQCPCTIHLRDQRVAEQTGNKVNQHMNNKDQKGGGVGEGAVDQCGSFIFKKKNFYPDLVNRPLDACFNALSLYTQRGRGVRTNGSNVLVYHPSQRPASCQTDNQ